VDHKLVLVIAVVAAAFIFDYINGFHDAANSIATVVSTRVLTPFQAVLWAAFFNFVAFALSIFTWQAPSARASSIRTSSTSR
jgi:PiT family inorganic phosphate transporter